MNDITKKGFLESSELKAAGLFPSEERMNEGPVAVIECCQNIPCNPCEAACPFGAITIGEDITNIPILDEKKCIGCGLCLKKCPGLAIFLIDKSKNMATISFPFEYFPLPEKGQIVKAVDRAGKFVCDAEVTKIDNAAMNDHTPIITISVPKVLSNDIRSIQRLISLEDESLKKMQEEIDLDMLSDDLVVCRCEEITVGEIKEAIINGATTVEGIKKRTRAGMGLCQGRTCSKLVSQMLGKQLGIQSDKINPDTVRMPIKPVPFNVYEE